MEVGAEVGRRVWVVVGLGKTVALARGSGVGLDCGGGVALWSGIGSTAAGAEQPLKQSTTRIEARQALDPMLKIFLLLICAATPHKLTTKRLFFG